MRRQAVTHPQLHATQFTNKTDIPGGPLNFSNMGKVRDVLNREQMETVAEAYTAGRECDF